MRRIFLEMGYPAALQDRLNTSLQHDDSSFRFGMQVTKYLHRSNGNRWTEGSNSLVCPSGSPDLTRFDFFL